MQDSGIDLVINVMNEPKQTRPFVDLLTSVAGAVVLLLGAADEVTFSPAIGLASPAMRGVKTWVTPDRYLTRGGEAPPVPETGELTDVLPVPEKGFRRSKPGNALANLKDGPAGKVEPLADNVVDDADEILGIVDTAKKTKRAAHVEMLQEFATLGAFCPMANLPRGEKRPRVLGEEPR